MSDDIKFPVTEEDIEAVNALIRRILAEYIRDLPFFQLIRVIINIRYRGFLDKAKAA